ncbi:hypothetical protein Q7C36_012288 [Tachysurus vachellii]|uniref:Uncharacterized protein n=1 Tax=Tachysurus vachellii TaxID=175792 RepID=A0AA88ML62_TACVA|nr:hypothetical protein Q7C36_012288 [Tachysurus vachellii]
MMKKAMLLCFVLFAVISVTTAAQCTKKFQDSLTCRDKIDDKSYFSGQTWVNSNCQFCKCEPGALTCCMGWNGKCKFE